MKYKFLLLLINLMAISCRTSENYYPPQSSEMAEGTYNKYKVKLDSAYLRNDHFEAAVQLANLKAPSNMIFSNLDTGIRENTENCYKVYEWYKLFNENNFQVNLVRADTLKYTAAYELCIAILGKQTFIDYQNEKEQKHQKEIDNRIKLDSTKFNFYLMSQLEQIEKEDQELRIKMNAKNITKEETENLWIKQNVIDTINLNKVEAILIRYGYPNKEEIGYDLANTIWLVLHHQSDLAVRDKYQKVIEANCGEGQIKAYNWKSEDIRLEKKHNKS